VAKLAAKSSVDEAADSAAPAVFDREHLRRMTFGDRALERELLDLFNRQAGILLDRMRAADAGSVAALAHTLKGSALGIGAMAVAHAAAAVEKGGTQSALDALATAVEAARVHIERLLREE
jgi:HPt (histidine-containing phosphotransfer) domain-containing protein